MKNNRYKPQRISKKLEGLIKTKFGDLPEKEMFEVVGDLKRFVKVAHRIATEPQYQAYINKDKKKVSETTISEFKKVMKSKKRIPLKQAFEEYKKVVDKDER